MRRDTAISADSTMQTTYDPVSAAYAAILVSRGLAKSVVSPPLVSTGGASEAYLRYFVSIFDDARADLLLLGLARDKAPRVRGPCRPASDALRTQCIWGARASSSLTSQSLRRSTTISADCITQSTHSLFSGNRLCNTSVAQLNNFNFFSSRSARHYYCCSVSEGRFHRQHNR